MDRYKSSNIVSDIGGLINHEDAIWMNGNDTYCCGYKNAIVRTFHVERSIKNIDVLGVTKNGNLLKDAELVYPYEQYHMTQPIDGAEVSVDTPVFYLSYPWSHNHQHWLIEDVPRLWMYFKLLKHFPDLHLLIDQNGKRSGTLELLGLLDIDHNKIVTYNTGQIMYVRQIFISSFFGVNFSYITPEAWDLYTTIRNTANSRSAVTGMSHIYVSRRDTKNGWWHNRELVNEHEIVNMAMYYGIEELIPTEYTLTDEIALFARAERIIGATGAGMVNLIWLSDDYAKVMIMNHPRLNSQFYCDIVSKRRGQCKILDGGVLVGDSGDLNVPWEYPLNLIERRMSWLLD